MRFSVTMVALLATFVACAQSERVPVVVVGSQATASEPGITFLELDSESGRLTQSTAVTGVVRPTWAVGNSACTAVYTVSEVAKFEGQNRGGVVGYSWDAIGKMTRTCGVLTGGAGPCHLALDRHERTLCVANYGDGAVSSFRVEPESGKLVPVSVLRPTGRSVDPKRQTSPHAHAVLPHPTEDLLFVADLGADRISVFRIDPTTSELSAEPVCSVATRPGSGPRHLALHPNGEILFCVDELSNTLTTFGFDRVSLGLAERGFSSTLPADFSARSHAAAIAMGRSGEIIYVSNRGHDSIAVFVLDLVTKLPTLREHVAVPGKNPWALSVDASGRWLLAAAQGSDLLCVYRVAEESGRLTLSGPPIPIMKPTSIWTGLKSLPSER